MPPLPDSATLNPRGAPAPLVAAAGLAFVEGLGTVGFGISNLASLSSSRIAEGLTGVVFFCLYGAGLIACAWGMRALRPWSRSPTLLAQLIFLGLAWNLRGDLPALAVAMAVLAGVVLLGLLQPCSIEALNREEHRRHREENAADGPADRPEGDSAERPGDEHNR